MKWFQVAIDLGMWCPHLYQMTREFVRQNVCDVLPLCWGGDICPCNKPVTLWRVGIRYGPESVRWNVTNVHAPLANIHFCAPIMGVFIQSDWKVSLLSYHNRRESKKLRIQRADGLLCNIKTGFCVLLLLRMDIIVYFAIGSWVDEWRLLVG